MNKEKTEKFHYNVDMILSLEMYFDWLVNYLNRYGKENIKGYIVGAKLFNILGLTTQVPNVTDIVTNECKYHKQYDEKLRTYITKPKIEITNENYRYLQFIDVLENRDNINIEVENANEILYKIIQECNLDFENIIKYARETKSKVAINKIIALAR